MIELESAWEAVWALEKCCLPSSLLSSVSRGTITECEGLGPGILPMGGMFLQKPLGSDLSRFTWDESLLITKAAFLHVTWNICSQLSSPYHVNNWILFAWNLSSQAGRMSSYADICGSKHAQGSTEGGYQRYGVRSYLHQFYEDCTASIWEYEDDFQIQRSPSRWSSAFWKVLPVAGYWGEKLWCWDVCM